MNTTQKLLQGITALILVIGLLAPVALQAGPSPSRLQPVLAQMAADTSMDTLAVIVRKADASDRAEKFVQSLGGRITMDLHIINAFAAELPARQVPELAKTDAVSWVSLDAPVKPTGKPTGGGCTSCPVNTYLDTLDVQQVWDLGLQGDGVSVAVIDSGIATDRDFTTMPGKPFTRILKQVSFNPNSFQTSDESGHGTHVAGIVGGHGGASGGLYSGIAPKVNLINLKISDENGMAYESYMVDAMQWALDNKDQYNIRVVNLSVNSSVESSYHTSPLNAAAEILWFNGVVVVASAGNTGSGYNPINAAPANDPFIITVGASNEQATADRGDDTVASFSAFGVTSDGFVKPDLIAPGKDIISVLASSSDWDNNHPERTVWDKEYFRISGTSMAAPMVTGAIALLLQDEPNLTPDQVKHRLTHTGSTIAGSAGDPNSYPYLDIQSAILGTSFESANTGLVASQLLWTGTEPVAWNSVSWNSVSWNSVSWNSVSWNSVSWNSVSWNSVSWAE